MKHIHQNSKESYREYKTLGKQEVYRYKIWRLLKTSNHPMTDRDIMQHFNEPDPNNIRPEITRLKEDRLVMEIGKTKCPRTNKTVRLSAATDLAYFPRGAKREMVQEALPF